MTIFQSPNQSRAGLVKAFLFAAGCAMICCNFASAQPPGKSRGNLGGDSYENEQGGNDEYEMEMDMDDMEMEMEMEMDDGGYGDEYGGPGGPGGPGGGRSSGRRGGASSPQDVMNIQLRALTNAVGTMDLSPLMSDTGQPEVEAGPVLGGEAEEAYKGGNHALAMQLYFAHMVTEFDEARVNLQTVKYSKLLRRPVWQIRWGVSYTVRGDATADPDPIRPGKTQPGAGIAAGNRRGGGRGAGFTDEYGDQQDSEYEDMDAGMEEEMGMDSGGEEYEMEMEMEMERGGGRGPGGPGRGGGGNGFGSESMAMAPQRTMLDAATNAELDKHLGLVAKIVADEFRKRYEQGDFGNAMCTLSAAPPVIEEAGGRRPGAREPIATGRPRGPVDDLLDSSPETPPLWIPGVVFLGEGDSKDILKSSVRDGIELILHFDIGLKTNRTGDVQNISRCRLLHVATGKSLGVSKGMDSFEVAQMVRVGRTNETSYVSDQLSGLFLVIDRHVKTMEMPRLSPEVARKRVGTLLSSTGPKRLQALAEVRLYQAQGLLSAEDAELAFSIVGGQDGLAILHGSQEKKLEIAREWCVSALPKSQ